MRLIFRGLLTHASQLLAGAGEEPYQADLEIFMETAQAMMPHMRWANFCGDVPLPRGLLKAKPDRSAFLYPMTWLYTGLPDEKAVIAIARLQGQDASRETNIVVLNTVITIESPIEFCDLAETSLPQDEKDHLQWEKPIIAELPMTSIGFRPQCGFELNDEVVATATGKAMDRCIGNHISFDPSQRQVIVVEDVHRGPGYAFTRRLLALSTTMDISYHEKRERSRSW